MSESTAGNVKSMDEIVALCRRRGFIWQSSELYGGINGFWDYGPLGAELKRNLKNAWYNDLIHGDLTGPDGKPLDIVPVDTTIIMHPKVWEASGHVAGFNDPMVDCRACKSRFRADHLWLVTWANEDQFSDWFYRHQADHADLDSDTIEALRAKKQQWRGCSEEDIAKYGEALRLRKHLDKKDPAPIYDKCVLASSEDEAMQAKELSGRERKILRNMEPYSALSLIAHQSLIANAPCPNCGEEGTLTEPRQFNLMYETYNGPVRSEDNKTYLRPETAQGIFTQFWNVVDTSRVKVPFGIGQVGKAFRNEVTPRNFTFRSREFEQMEIEFFITPPEHLKEGEASPDAWYAWWRDQRFAWWQSIGLAGENLILREHDRDELAHYAKEGAGTSDVEYRFPFTAPGFGELEGIAHRTDFDLRQHAEHSGKGEKLRYFDQEREARYFPHVIEPSAGADRGTLAVLCEAYTPTPERKGSKAIMSFHPRLAPIKAAIFPLVNKDGMPEVAEKLYKQLKKRWNIETDAKQSIGKRYARMDEAGTPYCFTIDGQTLEDQTVTMRERDSGEQQRMALDQVEAFLGEKLG